MYRQICTNLLRDNYCGGRGGGEDRVYPGVLISCQISHPGDPGQNGGDRMMYFL